MSVTTVARIRSPAVCDSTSKMDRNILKTQKAQGFVPELFFRVITYHILHNLNLCVTYTRCVSQHDAGIHFNLCMGWFFLFSAQARRWGSAILRGRPAILCLIFFWNQKNSPMCLFEIQSSNKKSDSTHLSTDDSHWCVENKWVWRNFISKRVIENRHFIGKLSIIEKKLHMNNVLYSFF